MPAPDYAKEITDLEAALASGELTVEINDERVTYKSFADISRAITYFTDKAAKVSGPVGVGGQFGFSAVAYSRD